MPKLNVTHSPVMHGHPIPTQAALVSAGLLAGSCLVAGNLFPVLDWLFYPGLLLAAALCQLGRPSRWIAYALTLPYFILVGLAVWLPVFPWFTGIILALLLAELAGRLLYKLLRQADGHPLRFLVMPGFLFLLDYAFRHLPLLNRINLVPLLAAVFQQGPVLVPAAVFGASLTVWLLAATLAGTTALAAQLCSVNSAGRNRRFGLPALLLMLCGVMFASAYAWKHAAEHAAHPETVVAVAVVQGSYQPTIVVRSNDDLAQLHEGRLNHYVYLAGQSKADIYVFPETEFGLWDRQNRVDQHYRQAFHEAADRLGAILLLCVTEGDSITQSKADRFFSAVLLDSKQVYGLTAKRNLVPFSETSRYSAGERYEVFSTSAGTLGVSICYDMQGQAVERLKMNGARLILAPFNDSSFPAAYHQMHRAEAALRAAECAIPIALANEDGISQLVDAYGHVMAELGYREQGVLVADMKLTDSISPYLAAGRYLAAAAAAVHGILFFRLLWPGLACLRNSQRPVTRKTL